MRSPVTGWLFLAPTITVLAIFGFLPFLYVAFVGFFDWNPFAANPGLVFAGVNNYRRLVFDDLFLRSIGLTLQFTFWVVLSELVIGYLLAQLFMRDFPLKGLFRTIHTLPLLVAPIAVGASWKLLPRRVWARFRTTWNAGSASTTGWVRSRTRPSSPRW